MLSVRLLSERARVPEKGSVGSVGYDLFSAVDTVIEKNGGRALIPTDITIKPPDGTYGRVAPRSGLALKRGINVGAGVIDPDYEGNVCVLLFNHDKKDDFRVGTGDKIAQLVIEKVDTPKVMVESFAHTKQSDMSEAAANVSETRVRGSRGFGSSDHGIRE